MKILSMHMVLSVLVMVCALSWTSVAMGQNIPQTGPVVGEGARGTPLNDPAIPGSSRKASRVIEEMASLVKSAEARVLPILAELRRKEINIQQAEARYDKALSDFGELVKLAGPNGEFEKRIAGLEKIANGAIARLESHRNPKLRKLVDSIYRPGLAELERHLKDLKRTHGNILRKMRALKEEKEAVVEFSRAALFQEAIALVEGGVREYKVVENNLGQILIVVRKTEKKLGVTD